MKRISILLTILTVLSYFTIININTVIAKTSFDKLSIDSVPISKENSDVTESSTSSDSQPFGWSFNDEGWSYTNTSGEVCRNKIYTIEGKKYFFNQNGIMKTGVHKYGGKLYYFSESESSPEKGLGAMALYVGWKKIGSCTYFFNSNNSLATGWKNISKKTFYFNENGKMKIGWMSKGKKKFYFKTTGKLGLKGKAYTGWNIINKKKFYFYSKGNPGVKGKMITGMKKIGKFKYYFNQSGVLQKKGVVGTKKIGYYYADKSGKINLKTRKAVIYKGKKWNILNGKAVKVKNNKQLTLFRALKLVSKVTKKNMSKPKKLKICFEYVKKSYVEKNPRIPHYHKMNWPEVYANDMFVDGAGNCFSYAAAFAYMAKAIGYNRVYCCNSGGHGWAEIKGLVYDPEWSKHHFSNDYYALSYNTKLDQNYKGAIAQGYKWMHIKL